MKKAKSECPGGEQGSHQVSERSVPGHGLYCSPRRHTLSRRRIIPLPQWKANPETDPEALFPEGAAGAGPISPDHLLLPCPDPHPTTEGKEPPWKVFDDIRPLRGSHLHSLGCCRLLVVLYLLHIGFPGSTRPFDSRVERKAGEVGRHG